MGKDKFIQKFCVQTAVYWGTPVQGGYGAKTFADPVDISVRWDGITQVITDARTGAGKGKEITSTVQVLLYQNMDVEGYLYLGSVDDFDSDVDTANPKTIDGAYEIKKFEKRPFVKSTSDFVRTAYL